MNIRTKIVATVGPASSDYKMLHKLAKAGVDVFRINFSHGTLKARLALLKNIRQVEKDIGQPLAIMGDLCGPKIRVNPIVGGSVLLAEGHEIVVRRNPIEGTPTHISTTLGELVDEVAVGEAILIDDGKLRLKVIEVDPPKQFVCRVIRGGVLSSGKGVNLPHTALRLSALTEKDRKDAAWIAKHGFDYVALSFVRTAGDVNELRSLLKKADCDAHIIAKIEKPQAVKNIHDIIATADGIMVARGDLGVEMDLPAVPIAQKRIAYACHIAGRPCIIATQMLESMTHSAVPTRAEVSDVANAVLDLADAVMLSGETAVGEYPVETVKMMNEIVAHTQPYHDKTYHAGCVTYAPAQTAAALAAAVREIMKIENIAAVAVYTASGTTARMFAKNRLPCPVLALAPTDAIVRRMCLYYGVETGKAASPPHTRNLLALAAKFARQRKIAKKGDRIVVVSGRPIGKPGHTNTLAVHTV